MKRRRFLLNLASAFIASALGIVGPFRRKGPALAAARNLPRRVLEAVRTRRYPGPVKALDRDAIAQQGKWAG